MRRHWFKPNGECISRLPDVEGDKPKRQKFKRYPIGFFHIDIAEVQTAEGKLFLFVGIDRTSKFAVTQLVDKADRKTAWEFLQHMLEAFADMRLILSDPHHSHRSSQRAPPVQARWRGAFSSPSSRVTGIHSLPGPCALT
ncbi:hypothetical protein JHW48_12455 [Paracoccus aestuarii]|nr:hypothetical protein JHW48_12455 [Paracoccus aestuarii]